MIDFNGSNFSFEVNFIGFRAEFTKEVSELKNTVLLFIYLYSHIKHVDVMIR